MKKNLLFLFAVVLCTTVMMAQNQKPVRNSLSNSRALKSLLPNAGFIKKAEAVATESVANMDKSLKAPQADLSYSKPAGTYHLGPFLDVEDGGPTAYYPALLGKANYDWKFVASGGSSSDYSWKVNTTPLETDADGKAIFNRGVGSWILPTVTSGTDSYIWHKEVASQYATASDGIYLLSMVDIWKGGTGKGWGNKLSAFGSYVYGTGFKTSTGTSVACFQKYDIPQGPLYIESVNISVFSNGNNPLPNGSKMICSITPVKSNGFPDFENPIAVSECSADDIEDWGLLFADGTKWLNAPFYFYEEDPVSGFYSLMDLAVSNEFAIVLEWTNGANFGCLFGESDTDGSKSRVLDDAGYAYNYYVSGTDGYQIDLLFNINGVMPELSLDSRIESVEFDPEGGEANVTYTGAGVYRNVILISTFSADDGDVVIDQIPDWITVDEMNDLFDDDGYFENAVSIVFDADPLPEGVSGRSADIVVRAHGVTTTIPVTQGNPTGISSPKVQLSSVNREGDDFVLKYPASSATSVSVFNVAGQKVASYQLPASGTFTVPAGNYPKGVYLFNFTGANGASTVKMTK